jgi:3-phytase
MTCNVCTAPGDCPRFAVLSLALAGFFWLVSPGFSAADEEAPSFEPVLRLVNPEAKDQDDACIWIHPHRPGESTVIASDKSASRLFVYDLDGRLLQSLAAPKPGNIDIRQNVKLGGRTLDLVVVNQRIDGFRLLVYRVDPDSRQLERLDDGNCSTGPNYGGCLFQSGRTGRLYFFCTSESGIVEQHELQAQGDRGVKALKVRTLNIGKCEGAVADDEAGQVYIAEEAKGVWKFGAAPDDPERGTLIARVGEHGMRGDVEGLAIVRGKEGSGMLLVSDQGRSRFQAYQRAAPHRYIGEFAVAGAADTDGIEVSTQNFGGAFPDGVFVCHTDRSPRPLLVVPLGPVRAALARAAKE